MGQLCCLCGSFTPDTASPWMSNNAVSMRNPCESPKAPCRCASGQVSWQNTCLTRCMALPSALLALQGWPCALPVIFASFDEYWAAPVQAGCQQGPFPAEAEFCAGAASGDLAELSLAVRAARTDNI